MPQLPFEIPLSLAGYAEQFDSDPSKITEKLQKHLQKRGSDAVGHFLLAWFFHLDGKDEEAMEQALKAKNFAPGSPFLEKLNYYLSHPRHFGAWTPSPAPVSQKKAPHRRRMLGPDLDLDTLIEQLSQVDSQKIQPDEQSGDRKEVDLSKGSFEVDEIASETLANIHEIQGKTGEAIRTYERLKKLNSEKKEFYKEQISRLQKLQENRDEENEGPGNTG